MAGQSNIFAKPEAVDPFGNPTYATNGIFDGGKVNRPNQDSGPKQASQSAWEKSISHDLNKIK